LRVGQCNGIDSSWTRGDVTRIGGKKCLQSNAWQLAKKCERWEGDEEAAAEEEDCQSRE
jgi:hypothetical protein